MADITKTPQPDQFTKAEENSAKTSNTEKENMEVHHHAHHGHEKKTWKNYFWEFFMLFLAVFCGSLAELQVEHYVEHKREKTYALSLREDLLIDTANLSKCISTQDFQILRFDSLRILLNKSEHDSSEINTMYFLARIATRKANFFPNNRTLTQLRNSGNFRLIRNTNLADKLAEYQQKLEGYEYNSSFDRTESEKLTPFIGRMFDTNVFETMIKKDITIGPMAVHKPVGKNNIRYLSTEAKSEFLFYLHQRKTSFKTEARLLIEMKKIAEDMIKIIETDY